LAGIGLAKGSGLGVSVNLTSAATAYNSSPITGVVQANYSSYSPANQAIVQQIPPFMSGIPPAGVGPSGSINSVSAVVASGNALFANGVTGFSSHLGQAASYAATTFAFHGAIMQSQGQKFNDLGFSFNNYGDVATGGVSSQFDAVTSAMLAQQLPNLGTMFDIYNMFQLTNPGTLAQNLINQGLGLVGNFSNNLLAQGLNLNDLPDAEPLLVETVLSTITGSNLQEMIMVTNFRPYNLLGIRTLNDVFNINNLFSPDLVRRVGDLANLANKLGNVGGSFASFTQAASLYGSIEYGNYPTLQAMNTVLPSSHLEGLSSQIGQGSGVFNNPTVTDITGSASGVGYTDSIQKCTQAQTSLVQNDRDVAALHTYLAANPQPDPGVLQGLVNGVNTKPELQDVINSSNEQYINIGSQLATEQQNQAIAGVQLGSGAPTGNMMGVMNLNQQIPSMALDPMALGLGSTLHSMSTPDVYGEAMQASLSESRNLSRLQVFGVNPGTKMDAMAYARQLGSMRGY